MQLQPGWAYRARTANGDLITFRVKEPTDGVWVVADVLSADGPEPNVWLNTQLLLWISSEERRSVALSKATEQAIEELERTTEP